ncbi:NTP transferase domain-containing protein [Oricola sp.]|uniref:nucleotidyltransferase family protein n=1 Tax=Oricola sp. TaxID=1979950 RepID=UPI003512CA95
MLGRSKRPEKAAAVVLAAGRSTRMGADNKLLLQLEPGVPVVCRAVEVGLSAGLAPVYVVTGHQAGEVRTALNGLDCRFVHNPDYAGGLSGSIRAGFREAIGKGASGVLVLLGDMPFLPVGAITAVLSTAVDMPDRIVQGVHDGKPAHPVWLPAGVAELVEKLDGDRGVRSLVAETGKGMVSVEVGIDAAFDLDTPADFAAAQARTVKSGN